MDRADQLPDEDVTRQISIRIKQNWAGGCNPPKHGDEEDVFQAREEKSKKFHEILSNGQLWQLRFGLAMEELRNIAPAKKFCTQIQIQSDPSIDDDAP